MSQSPELHVNQSYLFAGAKRPKYLGRSNCSFNDESIAKTICTLEPWPAQVGKHLL